MSELPEGYQCLDGSERRPHPSATSLGHTDEKENVKVTIILRRRPDGRPCDLDQFRATSCAQGRRLPKHEFAALYGALPPDTDKVTQFVTSHSLTVVDSNAARRTIVATGTVAQINTAFAVKLGSFLQPRLFLPQRRTVANRNVLQLRWLHFLTQRSRRDCHWCLRS